MNKYFVVVINTKDPKNTLTDTIGPMTEKQARTLINKTMGEAGVNVFLNVVNPSKNMNFSIAVEGI